MECHQVPVPRGLPPTRAGWLNLAPYIRGKEDLLAAFAVFTIHVPPLLSPPPPTAFSSASAAHGAAWKPIAGLLSALDRPPTASGGRPLGFHLASFIYVLDATSSLIDRRDRGRLCDLLFNSMVGGPCDGCCLAQAHGGWKRSLIRIADEMVTRSQSSHVAKVALLLGALDIARILNASVLRRRGTFDDGTKRLFCFSLHGVLNGLAKGMPSITVESIIYRFVSSDRAGEPRS
ncbi:hypothetical protein BJ912DRAFT_923167 [Pholiota molesta]|nr:hypothetical protein BJ912DRAFT_923167 [Pholiota molesta]